MSWKDNMKVSKAAEIEDYDGDDFTKVLFRPDLKLFHMKHINADMICLFKKRAYDLAGIMDKKVKISLNGKKLRVDSFKDYVDLYDL